MNIVKSLYIIYLEINLICHKYSHPDIGGQISYDSYEKSVIKYFTCIDVWTSRELWYRK